MNYNKIRKKFQNFQKESPSNNNKDNYIKKISTVLAPVIQTQIIL